MFVSGSGPGALPGAPRGTPLDSASENFGVLKAVEMRGSYSYKIDYSSHFDASPYFEKELIYKDMRVQAI